MAPSRSEETRPSPTQATFTISCSFVICDLAGGGEEKGEAPFHPILQHELWACELRLACPPLARSASTGTSVRERKPLLPDVAAGSSDWPLLNFLLPRNTHTHTHRRSSPSEVHLAWVLRAKEKASAP